MVQIKRAYERPSPRDGSRILVDRLWPRELKKGHLKISEWMKELGPGDELRKWFGHDPARWEEFKNRYRQELGRPQAEGMLKRLAALAKSGTLTLVYSAKDVEHNQAAVIKEILDAR